MAPAYVSRKNSDKFYRYSKPFSFAPFHKASLSSKLRQQLTNPKGIIVTVLEEQKNYRWQRYGIELLAFVFVMICILIPRLGALGSFVTADEPAWGKRSAGFYYALSNGDYAATYQTGHPGVTTMWAGAAAYYLRFPKFANVGQAELGDEKLFQIFQNQGVSLMQVLATARLFVVLLITGCLAVSFYYARRLFGLPLAVLSFLLIAFEPFHVAHSRVLHTNGILATFMFLAVLAYLYFLRSRKWYALLVSAAAAGLSYISITPGFLLVPVMGVLALVDGLRPEDGRFDFNPRRLIQRSAIPLVIWGFTSLLVVYVVWPAMWGQPVATIMKIVQYTQSAAEGDIGGVHLVQAFQSGGDESSSYFYFYPLTYLWRTTPIVLAGLLLAAVFLIRAWRIRASELPEVNRRTLWELALYVGIYTLIMSFGDKKFDRYFLPAYLPLDVLAAYGWLASAAWLGKRLSAWQGKLVFAALFVGVIAIQAAGTLQNYPYYLTYFNPLLGGTRGAEKVMMVGWGEGLNEAALYLKQVPNIRQKRILSWYSLAFDWYGIQLGVQSEVADFSPETSLQDYLNLDYLVVYVNQLQRKYPPDLIAYLEQQDPVYEVKMNGVDYVYIYRLNGQNANP